VSLKSQTFHFPGECRGPDSSGETGVLAPSGSAKFTRARGFDLGPGIRRGNRGLGIGAGLAGLAVAAGLALAAPIQAYAAEPAAIVLAPSADAFPLIAGGKPARIEYDQTDFPGAIRAIQGLRGDLAALSGTQTTAKDARRRHHRHPGSKRRHRRPGRLGQAGRLEGQGPVGSLRPAGGREPPPRCRPRPGHRRIRQARHDLRGLRPFGTRRRLALDLVGRCPRANADGRLRHPWRQRPEAGREVPRHLLKRRGASAGRVGSGQVRRREPCLLRAHLRADPAAEGRLSVARHVGQVAL
jgi:hypothetical protein